MTLNPTAALVAGTIGYYDTCYGILPEWFGAVGDGVTDDTTAVRAAIAWCAALTGPEYGDTMGQAPFGYGDSRRLVLSGKKYAISGVLTLANNVGIYAQGGGFLALSTFTAGAYMVDTGANPYCGRVESMTLDCGGFNIKGANIQNPFMTRWDSLSVINYANDAITVTATGPEFYLTNFDLAASATPNGVNVAGLRISGSDGNYSDGVIKFTPIPIALNGGGNNTFSNVHVWGEYTGFKTYCPVWAVNSSRNTFVSFYADSPTKQDFTQSVNAIVNGIPNGGLCFYFDANSQQNNIFGGRGFVSTALWAAFAAPWSGSTAYAPQRIVTSGGVTYCCILANTNQAPPNSTYWAVIPANQFYLGYIAGQFNQIIAMPYNYAGNWVGDWLFSSDPVRDSCLVIGSPSVPNGMFPARLGMLATLMAGSVRFVVANTDLSGNASSSAQTAYNVNNVDIGADVAVYGSAGVSYVARLVNGVERHRSTARGLELTGGVMVLKSATVAAAAGEVILGNSTATVVGGAGGAAALPATPLGYLTISVGTTIAKIPYYPN